MADAPKPASAQDVIDTLKSMDQSLKALVAHFGAAFVGADGTMRPKFSQTSHEQATGRTERTIPDVATDRDLDSTYGDPTVRAKSPHDWTGEDQLGKPFSECPPEYLEMVADRLDYFSETEDDAKKLKYQRLDASRARGWAKRLRGGWKPPIEQESAFPSDAAAVEVPEEDLAF